MSQEMFTVADGQEAFDDRASLEILAGEARRRVAGAFDELARRLGGRLMAYSSGVLRDRGLAEEAVQETLIRIYRFLPRYRQDNFTAWSFTIANRVCANLLRRESRHARIALLLSGSDHDDDPTQAVGNRVAIEAAFAALPKHLRQTFLLRQQGLDYAEIGRVLSIPTGTVRSRLSRARDALRAGLRAAGVGDSPGGERSFE